MIAKLNSLRVVIWERFNGLNTFLRWKSFEKAVVDLSFYVTLPYYVTITF